MRFEMWKSKAQKGAFLVFTALMIPIIFLCAGFAVDLGNAWAYKSKLQNAADAAALAGASHFTNGDSYEQHPYADSYANQFLKANYGYLPNPVQNLKMQAQEATEKNPKTGKEETHGYYRVAFSEKVPVTFMGMFNYDGLDVGVEAVAIIPRKGTSTKGSFINVGNWIDGSVFDGNSTDLDPGHNIDGPFFYPDSKIVINNHEKYEEAIHHTTKYYKWTPEWAGWVEEADGRFKTFWPETAGETRKEAIDNGQFNLPVEGNELKYEQACKKANSEFESMFSSVPVIRNGQKYSINVNSTTTDKYVLSSTIQNLEIDLFDNSNGSKQDQPVYIYVKGNLGMIKINLTSNITRPVIFWYPGHLSWSQGATNIQFNSYGHDFRGSIYTPNSQIMPFNFDPGTFRGSITADAIALNSNYGYFKWESFGTPADIGGGESGSGAQEDKLRLVINNKLQW